MRRDSPGRRRARAALLVAPAALLLLLALPPPLGAHELARGVGTMATFYLFGDHIEAELNLGFSAAVSFIYLTEIDGDGDDEISAEEADAFTRRKGLELINDLELRVNGRALRLEMVKAWSVGLVGAVGVHPFDTYFKATAPIPSALPEGGGWWLHYHDGSFEGETASQFTWIPYTGHGEFISYRIFEPLEHEEQDIGFRAAGRDLICFFDTSMRPEIVPGVTSVPAVEELLAIDLGGGGSGAEGAGPAPAAAPTGPPASAPAKEQEEDEEQRIGNLVREIARGERSGFGLIWGILIAMIFGAGHALGPGHGKTMVAAYLVGTKGRIRDAITLGSIVTVAHTASIFLLGLLLLYLIERSTEKAASATYKNWMITGFSLFSGLLLLLFGLVLARRRYLATKRGENGHHHHHHGWFGHSHPHHDRDHEHQHEQGQEATGGPASATLRDLVALGVSGGIVPCPAGFTIMLVAAHYQALALGLVVLSFFSLGLGAILIGIGITLVLGKGKILDRLGGRTKRVMGALPVLSALVVAGIGLFFIWDSIDRGRVPIAQMMRAAADWISR